jgi:hypothetical protein
MGIDLNRIIKIHAVLLATTVAAAWITRWAEPASIVLGGAVMGVNFWLMRVIAAALSGRAVRAGEGRRVGLAVGALALKFGLFLGLLALLLTHVPVEGMSFAVGVTLLLVACVVEAARGEWLSVKGAN